MFSLTEVLTLGRGRVAAFDAWGMSMLTAEVQHIRRRKLTVTPGMICLGHVRGRPKEFAEWIHLDLEYIDTWSLWRDVRLVLLSPWSMASGRNY